MTNASSASASASSKPAGFGFPKQSRLLKRAQFVKVQTDGRRYGCPFFSVTCLHDAGLDSAKAGLTASRRIGNSVVRNRLRRRMREAIRHELTHAQPGWMFVFFPRTAAADAPMPQLREEVARAFRQCRL